VEFHDLEGTGARQVRGTGRAAVRLPGRIVRHPAQLDAEVVPVRRQQQVVRIQPLLGPGRPWVWMSIRPLMDTRPPGVSLEQMVLRVKCDSPPRR
jgi:hypothetical protein